jgi:hypothetical protein
MIDLHDKKFYIRINGMPKPIDVRKHYKYAHKMDFLPTTPTMSGCEIRVYDDAVPSRSDYTLVTEAGGKPIEDMESVALTNGMVFILVPPARY